MSGRGAKDDKGDKCNSRTVVVGAGVVGLCTAIALQKSGRHVVLIDRGEAGGATSRGNAGHLATELIDPLASPSVLLEVPGLMLAANGPLSVRRAYLGRILPWLARFVWAARPAQVATSRQGLLALNACALESWWHLVRDTGLSHCLQQRGALQTFEKKANLAKVAGYLRRLSEGGINYQRLSGDEAREVVPALSPAVETAILYPDSASVTDPFQLSQGLFSHFIASGGDFRSGDVVSVSGRGVAFVGGDALPADAVVVCAGAWSKKLAAGAGYSVPLETERGYHLMLLAPPLMPELPVYSFERKCIVTPMSTGLRVAGRVELGGLDLPPDYTLADRLMSHATALFPGLNAGAGEASRWMGFRPTLPDSLPVIDACRRQKGLFFAFGHQHLGLTQAAVTGKLVADLVAGRSPGLDLHPYRIDRF